MYKHHPQLPTLNDKDVCIWSYMDIFKYLNILEKEKIFLRRVDTYQDKYDGHMPDFKVGDTLNGFHLSDEMIRGLNKAYYQTRRYSYANCWTINDYESSLMWDCYSNNLGGVAIKSTFQRLCDSIVDECDIYVSPVSYNYPNIDLGNVYWPLISKRQQFKDEREIRIFFNDKAGFDSNAKHNAVDHVYIKVNLETLIEGAFFHPATPDWILETLNAVLSKYSINKVPIKSTLYSNPS